MSTDPLIGKKLGDYIIVDILGHGGMARVYRGIDKKLNRYAAVKVIDAHLIADQDQDEYRQRFVNEARAIARLDHPNIVGIYQFDQVGTLYYMAMNFIEGRDLRAILKDYARNNTYMPYVQALKIIRDIGSALDYAHDQGVIHRDIKPSNIMVTPTGRAVLTDFGLALSVPEGTVGNTFGSAHYIAPEQAVSSAQAVPQSDLYSLGVVLFEMLTNRVPFSDHNAMAVAMKHLNDPAPAPSTANPNIASKVDSVVLKALHKTPNKRFGSGMAMAQALEVAFAMADGDVDAAEVPSEVRGLPSWGSSPSRPSRISNASRDAVILEQSYGTRPRPLDDAPTVSDSKKSQASRAKLLEQQRAKRMRLYGGMAALVIVALVVASALVSSMGSGSPTAGTPDMTGTRIASIAQAATQTASGAGAVSETMPEPSPIEVTAEATGSQPATLTPTDTPTATQPPTETLPNTQPPTTTQAPPAAAEAPVTLLYDDESLVLLNTSNGTVDVSGLTFVQTLANGAELTFESARWEGGSRPPRSLPPGDCFQVFKNTTPTNGEPASCDMRHAWSRVASSRWFWTSDNPAATFEVRRGDAVLATCKVSAGTCGFSTD